MVQDKLRLNDAKTEFLIIGTRAQLNKVMISDLQVGVVNRMAFRMRMRCWCGEMFKAFVRASYWLY